MWIYTNDSFVSVVKPHGQRNDLLLVRARVKGDIESLFPKAKVRVTPGRDYRFRAFIPKRVVIKVFSDRIDRIDYDNFKDSVADKKRHDHYSKVWWATQDMQEGGAYGGGYGGVGRLHPEIQKALTPKRGNPRFDAWGDVVYDIDNKPLPDPGPRRDDFSKMFPAKKSPRKGA